MSDFNENKYLRESYELTEKALESKIYNALEYRERNKELRCCFNCKYSYHDTEVYGHESKQTYFKGCDVRRIIHNNDTYYTSPIDLCELYEKGGKI
jgi:hypothetical protein